MANFPTYWHLQGARQQPSDYDITTSMLLTYPGRGFEVESPIAAWYARFQTGSALSPGNLAAFRDPAELTYTRYTELRATKERYVDQLLELADNTEYDASLTADWLQVLDFVVPTLRYPLHGLQMVAAYVGHMAPNGRVAIACALQAADELRRVQRLAYRMAQLRVTYAPFGVASKASWQADPQWQPLRELIEHLLVVYDWGEAFVALNLVCKPMLDHVFMAQFAKEAEAQDDPMLAQVLRSLASDGEWHYAWTVAMARRLLERDATGAHEATRDNRVLMSQWIDLWSDRTDRALQPLARLFTTAEVPTARAMGERLWLDVGLPGGRVL